MELWLWEKDSINFVESSLKSHTCNVKCEYSIENEYPLPDPYPFHLIRFSSAGLWSENCILEVEKLYWVVVNNEGMDWGDPTWEGLMKNLGFPARR